MALTRRQLDELYERWNRPEFIPPDPLEVLAAYPDPADREVAGLVAAALAYGRVNAILPSLRAVLGVLGSAPRDFVLRLDEDRMAAALDGLGHRFARPAHLAALLAGIGGTLRRRGSLEAAFLRGYRSPSVDSRGRPLPAAQAGLVTLAEDLRAGVRGDPGHLLADPSRGSACKRHHLYLRWMVRRDAVDPGGWEGVDPAELLPPLDTWTHRIALRAGWTARRGADFRTVLDVARL